LIITSAYFNAALLLINGCFFALRAVETLTIDPVHALFAPTMMQAVSFLVLFVYGILLTFGMIIMVNQRLNEESTEAKENLELMFNTSPDAVLVTRVKDGYFVNTNDGFTAITGYTRADVIGKTSLDINLWGKPAEREQLFTALTEKGFCDNVEALFQRKDGSQLSAIIFAKIIKLQGADHIISVTRDITERKKRDEYIEMGREVLQILNRAEDLQKSVQRVIETLKTRTGFDAVGIRLQDRDDFPYFSQQGFSDDFLRTENTLVERDAGGGLCRDKYGNVSLECTCGLIISGKADPSNPIFTSGGSFWINDSFPLLDLPAKDDPRHHPRNQCMRKGYASISIVPIRNKDRIIGLIQFNDRRKGCFTLETVELLEGIASHIGEALMRKQAEADKGKLEAQNRQLQKSESLGRMAASIAHHFNNQLGVVIGNLEIAIGGQPKGTPPARSLTAAMQAAWKSANMSRLMLTYLGQSLDKVGPLDISHSCRNILPILEAAIPANVVLKTDFSASGPVINSNPDYMQQILTNLITNAREAVGENRGIIALNVKTVSPAEIPVKKRFPIDWQSPDKACACLEVTDTGCGIAAKDIDQLFDPFYSTKFTGRGMGLAVVLGLVNSHKGVITVESKPGSGSTFRLFFPVSEEALPQNQTAENDRDITISSPSPGKMEEGGIVLVVEDEEPLRKMVAIMLDRLGFSALEAKDGIEALEVFGKHQSEIKLVLTDLTMPRMNGWEALTELRKLQPDIPVILASGYDKAHVMAEDHPELPQAFLGKPYDLAALRVAIKQALERKNG
jgi:PAS domain S-box-containing protein